MPIMTYTIALSAPRNGKRDDASFARRNSNAEIAEVLGITKKDVENYV